MNIIDPKLRKTIIVDGVGVVIRPLNGADKLTVSHRTDVPTAVSVARLGVVSIVDPPVKGMTIDDMPSGAIVEIASEIMEISFLKGDDEKNSPSARGSSPERSATPSVDAHSTSATATANGSSPRRQPVESQVT